MTTHNTPNISQALSVLMESRLSGLHVAMPARVETYDKAQQRASVQPIMRRAYISEEDQRVPEQYPVIEGVPIVFPGAGAYKMTWPINKGDIVFLIFSEGSIDKWLSVGGIDVDPDDDRRNALSDAVAIPGLLSFKGASDQVDDDALVIAGGTIKLGGQDATDPVMLKSEMDSLRSDYRLHTHLDPASGSTGAPQAPYDWSTPIAGSSVVKTNG
jgi:hypothetical protein